MTYDTILFESADRVARLTLNRPEKLNAFCDAMFVEINDALASVEADACRDADGDAGARVLVITGAGRGFCAGADLASIDPNDPANADIGATLERNYNPLVQRLRALPVPVLCAVNGVAAGAGCSLALAGDLTIAARSASFVLAFARIGLVPDAGSTFFLPQRIGKARATGLAMLGEKIDAETAEHWGLIWKCVADADFEKTIDAYAQRLAGGPTRALLATRQLLNAAEVNTLAEQLGAERIVQKSLSDSADFREGVTAFREKRAARFVGR